MDNFEQFLKALQSAAAHAEDNNSENGTEQEEEKEEFTLGLTEEDVPGTQETNEKIFRTIIPTNRMDYISKIPEEYWNEDLAREFLNVSPAAVIRIPIQFVDEDMFAEACRADHRVFGASPSWPKRLRTEKVALAALQPTVNGKQKRANQVLRKIPIEIKTSEFYEKAVAAFSHVLRHVPHDMQTWRMVVQGVADSKEDRLIVQNIAPRFRVKSLREAVEIAKEDPLFIDWERIDPLDPTKQ